jgi:hypothetical protein
MTNKKQFTTIDEYIKTCKDQDAGTPTSSLTPEKLPTSSQAGKRCQPHGRHLFPLRIHLPFMNRFAILVIENKLVIILTLEAKHVVQRAS